VSLCDEKAFANFRYCFHTENFPVAIYVGTDGIDDSFGVYGNDERLFEFYRNLTKSFAQNGLDGGKKELAEFLPVLTAKGSGDDVSISGIVDLEAIKALSFDKPEASSAKEEIEEQTTNAENREESVVMPESVINDDMTKVNNDE
jgi:hypothetical protein